MCAGSRIVLDPDAKNSQLDLTCANRPAQCANRAEDLQAEGFVEHLLSFAIPGWRLSQHEHGLSEHVKRHAGAESEKIQPTRMDKSKSPSRQIACKSWHGVDGVTQEFGFVFV